MKSDFVRLPAALIYKNDYQGVTPAQVYLLMSNLTNGAPDSARCGLLYKQDILGRVLK